MPRIRCHYLDCAFLDDSYCSAGMVEIDPDAGCMTYSATAGAETEDEWDEEEELEEWEEAQVEGEDESDEDLWLTDDEEE